MISPLIVTWFEVGFIILQFPGTSLPFSRMSMTFSFFQSPGTLPDGHDLVILGVETGGSTSHSYLSPLRLGAFYFILFSIWETSIKAVTFPAHDVWLLLLHFNQFYAACP